VRAARPPHLFIFLWLFLPLQLLRDSMHNSAPASMIAPCAFNNPLFRLHDCLLRCHRARDSYPSLQPGTVSSRTSWALGTGIWTTSCWTRTVCRDEGDPCLGLARALLAPQ
jgi:hypothetical protein